MRSRYRSEPRPLGGYLGALVTFVIAVGTATAVGRARKVPLPERLAVQDVVMLCVATHKASRLLAKESITSPLRAPFTEYLKPTGEAELNEAVRGQGGTPSVTGHVPVLSVGVVATALMTGLVRAEDDATGEHHHRRRGVGCCNSADRSNSSCMAGRRKPRLSLSGACHAEPPRKRAGTDQGRFERDDPQLAKRSASRTAVRLGPVPSAAFSLDLVALVSSWSGDIESADLLRGRVPGRGRVCTSPA